MDRRILERVYGSSLLSILAAAVAIMILFAMDAEQKEREREYGELKISRSAYLSYKAQYERSPE